MVSMPCPAVKITPLLILLAALPCACSKSAPEAGAPPKARLEEQLRKTYPKAELVSLTTEVRPAPDQIVEFLCKARLRVKEDLFKRVVLPGTGSRFTVPLSPFEAECVRRGLIVSGEQDRRPPTAQRERNLPLADEPKLRDTVILEPTQTKGDEFEVYGTIVAKRIIDRWEISPFEPADDREPAFGQPQAEFGPQAFIQGSAELERQYELAAERKKGRERRLGQRNAPLRAKTGAAAEFLEENKASD